MAVGIAAALAALVALTAPTFSLAAHAPSGTPAWGYEAANEGARILEYDVGDDRLVATCQPPINGNGRGVAHDPVDGNLWYTRLNAGFRGNGFIHKTTRPPECALVTTIPFGDGPGGSVQDAIGAVDVDPDDGHLWAAGYQPVSGTRSFLYKVDRETGAILASCWVPFFGGGEGNDTLTVARLEGLAGSGSYLLTDAGELDTNPPLVNVVDEASCSGEQAATTVGLFQNRRFTGIDYEFGRLFGTDERTLDEFGAFPFTSLGARMSTSSSSVEDIAVAGNRAPDCSGASASPRSLFPPNHKFIEVALGGVTDPDGDPISIAVDAVSQDEPVTAQGDNTSPDARAGSTPGRVELRAERNPRGDGRVYRIAFTASDGRGGSCSGEASVEVRRHADEPATDSSPPSFDSFGS